jgi:SAM-dependent methyltransferase
MKSPTCPRCGAENRSKVVFMGINADVPRSARFPIVRCLDCGIAFTAGSPATETEEGLYFEGYYGEATGERLSNRLAIAVFQKERQSLVMGDRMPSKVLDVGCGDGTFLRCLPAGVERFGYEPSLAGRNALTKYSVHQFDLDSPASGNEASFDLITLWQVFEHVDTPDDLLQKLRRLLATGGSVFISVPNFGSLQARIFRGRWFHLDPARHLFHYEKKTLGDACWRNGFDAGWRTTKSLEYGVFGWWQSFFNLIPFDFNMGYKILKGRKKYPLTPVNLLALAVYGLLAVPVGILSVGLMLLEASLGKGAVLQVCLTPKRDLPP